MMFSKPLTIAAIALFAAGCTASRHGVAPHSVAYTGTVAADLSTHSTEARERVERPMVERPERAAPPAQMREIPERHVDVAPMVRAVRECWRCR